MNRRLVFGALSAALLLAGCNTASTPQTTTATPPKLDLSSYRTLGSALGQTLPPVSSMLKTGQEGDSSQELVIAYQDRAFVDRLAAHLSARVGGDLPQLGLALLALPEQYSAKRAAAALSLSPHSGLRFAEANNYDAKLPEIPQSSEAGSKLSAQATDPDPLSIKQWWIAQVSADKVRDLATGKGVIVGVVDDDFDRQHEDLKAAGKIVTGIDTSTGKELTPDMPLTNGAHGSGSAGTIAERLGNGVGGAGIAPDAILMPVRIFSPGFSGSFNVARGLVYAVDHGAQVLNNSWGGGGYTQIIKEAVDYALSKNVVVVGSAGNDYRAQMSGPGAYTGAINVGASAGDDMKANFSNIGLRNDIYAPGDNGLTTYINAGLKSPEREQSYGLFNGTSMAAPVISGAAALLLEVNPKLTPYQVKKILAATGDPMKDPRTQGFNRVNVLKAVQAVKAGQIPADGGSVEVVVVDKAEASPITGTDVNLVPLDGQNRGMPYLGRTGNGRLAASLPGAFDPSGAARFFGVEPGRYRVTVAGPSVNVFGGTRDNIVGEINVQSGKNQQLSYTHQVDFYEYSQDAKGNDGRNNTPALATDLTFIPASAFAQGLLFGGTFDNANYVYAPPTTGKDVDHLKFAVGAGQTLTVEALARALGSSAVVQADLLDASGAVVATGKPSAATGRDSVVSFKAPAKGNYIVRFSNQTANEGLGAFYTSIVAIK
ncbi:S8 family serine peptidase [Deinococcus frigens]|uniref:S8 family serine peptidase n=1 Tax=Deinococcus frigens TaxID=249403 RepID=UPI000496448B|nr:S8 family serine peptidase [Deinococcus frigens]